jgi:hypothetical protein
VQLLITERNTTQFRNWIYIYEHCRLSQTHIQHWHETLAARQNEPFIAVLSESGVSLVSTFGT